MAESPHRSNTWRAITLILTLVGLLVLAIAIRRALAEAAIRLVGITALALAALPLFAAWTVASTLGWRAVLVGAGVQQVSLARLFVLRIQAQSINLVLPALGLGGDAFRASVLARATRQGPASTASVALDTAASIVACLLFAGLGTLVGWNAMRWSEPLRGLAVLGSLAIATAAWFAPSIVPRLAAWSWLRRWERPLRSMAAAMGLGRRSGYGRAIAWHLMERLLIVGEVWVYAWALGVHLSLVDAVFATALMTVLSSALFFVPGQVVAADGGLALGLVWAGAPWEVGIAVALARRLRQLLVGTVGMLLSLADLRRSGRTSEQRRELQVLSSRQRMEG